MADNIAQSSMEQRVMALEEEFKKAKEKEKIREDNGLVMMVFSGDMDRVFAALSIASGALASGDNVTLFFTLWGSNLLRKKAPQSKDKLFLQKMFGWMLPKGMGRLPLTRMNFLGVGPLLMKWLMKQTGTISPNELLAQLKKSGAQIYCCTTSMEIMGIKKEELIDDIDIKFCGAVKFMATVVNAKNAMFI